MGKTLIPVFTPDHVRAMLYLCLPNTWWGARDQAIILTLLHTGVRLSELCGLTLVDLEREDIRINRHTFAVNFLKAGGSLRHLQEIMRHTSMRPLEVYLRTIAADDTIVFDCIYNFVGYSCNCGRRLLL